MINRRKVTILTGILMLMAAGTISCGEAATEATLPETGTSVKQTETTEEKTEPAEDESQEEDSTKKTEGTETGEVKTIYPDLAYADETDEKIAISSTDNYIKTRENDNKSGDIVDASIYKDNNGIVKIITEDYGSEGRIVSEYYYNGDNVAYMKQYKTDIYGIGSSFEEADLEDIDADYTDEVLENADEALKKAKKNTGQTLLYGYVGDEQGGILKNVSVKLRNVAGDYTDEAVTDDDGYYDFNIPQKDDTYNLTFTYDNCIPSTENDVHITPGTPEYSLGRVYVAPEGNGVHDTDIYLMNVNSKSPVNLKDGEYAAELSSDNASMILRLVDLDDQSCETGGQIKINYSKSKKGYALFVEDGEYLSKDDMAGSIGRTYMTVTIFDKNGIVAAFREPSGRLGTLWKVCTIDDNGDIDISGLMYTDSKGWTWPE